MSARESPCIMRDNGGVRGPRTPSSKLAFRPNADGYLPGVKPARQQTREPRVREPRVRQPRPERSRERRPAPPPRPPRVRRSRETLPSPRRRRVLRALGAVVVVLLGMVGRPRGGVRVDRQQGQPRRRATAERVPHGRPTGGSPREPDLPAGRPGHLTRFHPRRRARHDRTGARHGGPVASPDGGDAGEPVGGRVGRLGRHAAGRLQPRRPPGTHRRRRGDERPPRRPLRGPGPRCVQSP